jgi:hypothetical protein
MLVGNRPAQRCGETVTVQARNRTMLAWLLFAATFACLAAGLAVTLALVRPLTVGVLARGVLAALSYLGFAVLGLILSLRRPANPIGWLYAASGLVWSLSVPGDAWIDDLIRMGRPLPLAAQFDAAIGESRWALAIALGVTLPLLLLPDGRLRSHRWRPAVWASVAGAVLVEVAGSLAPGQLDSWPITNPIGLGGVAGAIANVLEGVGLVLHVGSLAAALVCLVLRFRSSRGVERQQLRWVAAGATGAVVGLVAVVGLLALGQWYGLAAGAAWVAIVLALPCLPVTVAIAVLRYRLYDLDRIISRTLAYALLTVLLGGG